MGVFTTEGTRRKGEEMAGKTTYPLNSASDVIGCMNMVRSLGLDCRWSGLCVWVEVPRDELRATDRVTLEDMGASYAKKKGKLFFRACEGLPKVIETAA